jgi:hypothetical protein
MTCHSPFRITLRRILPVGLTLACLVMPSRSGAQDDGQRAPSAPSVPAVAAVPAAPAVETKQPPRYTENVKIEVTITDQASANKPVTKSVTAVVANRQNAQIRTEVKVPVFSLESAKNPGSLVFEDLPLDIDLYAEMLDLERVRIGLSLKYKTATKPGAQPDAQTPWTAAITQQFSVFLTSGKPLVISQSADAATDRKVTIEVKATILK